MIEGELEKLRFGKVVPGGGWFSYTLRQLTFNPSNFNSLSRYAVQSIGTFVTQCVQQPVGLVLLGTIWSGKTPLVP